MEKVGHVTVTTIVTIIVISLYTGVLRGEQTRLLLSLELGKFYKL